MSDCPCTNCIHYTCGKQHPNPCAWDLHYCELRKQSIYKTAHNHVSHPNQWVIPCGGYLYTERDKDIQDAVGYSRKLGLIYITDTPVDSEAVEAIGWSYKYGYIY
ncbi:MAG: hypothetical protein IK038_03245 [Bacteroidaceae bacterium]|nr:hypothetical protein [Bacteroidaceae bacterium]